MRNPIERKNWEVGPSDNWVGYLKWLGVKVEGPRNMHLNERKED